MASSRNGGGPKPWKQRQARTAFLQVPQADWPLVKRGLKSEFRASSGAVSGLKWVDPPIPVVAYSISRTLGHDARLMVLEERFQEPLAAISEESLAREGFDTFAEFRAYWCEREKRRFTPTRMIVAYRVRPFVWTDDPTDFAQRLFRHLYGEFIPDEEQWPAKAEEASEAASIPTDPS